MPRHSVKKAARSEPQRAAVPITSLDTSQNLPRADQKQFDRELLPFLRSIADKKDTAYATARQTISRLVIDQTRTSLTLVDKLLLSAACACSMNHLPGYATLDDSHILAIQKLLRTIREYVEDASQKRPLAFLMLASPGAGKSHFIKCVANRLSSENIGAITYDMAGLQSSEDMIPPLDAARNLKVEDRIPLLFLDEFDSAPTNIPLLLPLLWDGEVAIGARALKLGKVIIVLAGSSPALPSKMEQARSMRTDLQDASDETPKLIDLLSRINGGTFSIPPFHDSQSNIDRRPDKVCILVELLRQRFGKGLKAVPLALLRFVAQMDFRYGVRSLASLVNLIPYRDHPAVLTLGDLEFPFGDVERTKQNSIAYHLLHQHQATGVVETWRIACNCSDLLPVSLQEPDIAALGHYSPAIVRHIATRVLDGVSEAKVIIRAHDLSLQRRSALSTPD
jgi:hypothetical protein